MTTEDFNRIVFERCEKIKTMLAVKGVEYARGDDRLHAFKVAAAFEECTPERALRGMSIKHEVSIRDFVNDLDDNKHWCVDKWQEKLGDAINYLILLEALVIERDTKNAILEWAREKGVVKSKKK